MGHSIVRVFFLLARSPSSVTTLIPPKTFPPANALPSENLFFLTMKKYRKGPIIPTPTETLGDVEKFQTPKVKTIEDLTREPFNIPAEKQIKTLVYIVDDKPAIVLLRGDDQLNESKLAATLGTNIFRAAETDEIHESLGARPGSLGAVGVKGIPIYADKILQNAAGMITGANVDGFHVKNVTIARDIDEVKWADLRNVRENELSDEGHPIKIQRAIEVGHVFKLGTKYSESLQSNFLDEDGKRQPPVMGCYGLGVTRTLQAVIEFSHDENGIVWPAGVAPYEVCITPLSIDLKSEVMQAAMKLYDELVAKGLDVLLDDRDERAGAKFKDSELIGIPIRVAIGAKSLANGEMELTVRRDGGKTPVQVEHVVNRVLESL